MLCRSLLCCIVNHSYLYRLPFIFRKLQGHWQQHTSRSLLGQLATMYHNVMLCYLASSHMALGWPSLPHMTSTCPWYVHAFKRLCVPQHPIERVCLFVNNTEKKKKSYDAPSTIALLFVFHPVSELDCGRVQPDPTMSCT